MIKCNNNRKEEKEERKKKKLNQTSFIKFSVWFVDPVFCLARHTLITYELKC